VRALPACTAAVAPAAGAGAGAADLSVAGLTYQRRRPVFSDVTFDVGRSEVVALLGANGAGKSTLLRCLLRLVEPDAGTVRLLGETVTGARQPALRGVRRRVGFVFQRHNLVPRASVLTNVLHGVLATHGARVWSQALAPAAARERAMAALARVGLAELATRRADTLSGGQSQRVAIARALVAEPAIILADEPAASLDPAAGEEVMALLLALAREARVTVLFTSHHVDHALRADRALGLYDGRLDLDAPAAALDRARLAALYA